MFDSKRATYVGVVSALLNKLAIIHVAELQIGTCKMSFVNSDINSIVGLPKLYTGISFSTQISNY